MPVFRRGPQHLLSDKKRQFYTSALNAAGVSCQKREGAGVVRLMLKGADIILAHLWTH